MKQFVFGNVDKAKTFRPKRNHRVGTKRYELHKHAQATLGTGNLHEAVTLPEGEDENEWLAVNTVDFFNEINLLYGVIAEFCTEQACPVMCAGPKYEYMWADGQTVKRPMAVSAPRYVDFLMTWVQNQLDDEKLFPTQLGVPFPPDFLERVQNIFKRLFRVYAHIYYCHFERMSALGAEPHLNTCFRHFILFVICHEKLLLHTSLQTAKPPFSLAATTRGAVHVFQRSHILSQHTGRHSLVELGATATPNLDDRVWPH